MSNVATFVQMPNCKDCGKPWHMTKEKYETYNRICKNKPNFKMPIRCDDCRKQKEIDSATRLYENSMSDLSLLIQKIQDGKYIFKEDELSKELLEYKRVMKSVVKTLVRVNERTS